MADELSNSLHTPEGVNGAETWPTCQGGGKGGDGMDDALERRF